MTFQYPGAEEPALSGVSFVAMPGEVTAIIGGTGSGKSTLAGLIPRFYDVNDGRVLVDGVDVREMTQARPAQQDRLRPSEGGAVQRHDRRATSASDASRRRDDEVKHAANVAQAAEFIEQRPDGYAAPVAQGGTNLSGGQKQRLAIARALVRNAEIYVFDDSFSALDFATDAKLRAALKTETTSATVFIVSQRIGTVMNADRIVVLDDGRVAGIGTHADLLQHLRCVSRDRRIAGVARGGRMSCRTSGTQATSAAAEHLRARPDGRLRHAGAEGQGLQGHAAPAGDVSRSPHQSGLIVVIGAGVIATLFSVVGPKLLGNADDQGVRRLPGSHARESPMPGSTSRTSRNLLSWLVVLYVVSAAFLYLQQYLMSGIAQRTVYALRKEVEAKFSAPAAEVLRLAHARRDPQPRRQRSRQHQQHAAAEPDAAD